MKQRRAASLVLVYGYGQRIGAVKKMEGVPKWHTLPKDTEVSWVMSPSVRVINPPKGPPNCHDGDQRGFLG